MHTPMCLIVCVVQLAGGLKKKFKINNIGEVVIKRVGWQKYHKIAQNGLKIKFLGKISKKFDLRAKNTKWGVLLTFQESI